MILVKGRYAIIYAPNSLNNISRQYIVHKSLSQRGQLNGFNVKSSKNKDIQEIVELENVLSHKNVFKHHYQHQIDEFIELQFFSLINSGGDTKRNKCCILIASKLIMTCIILKYLQRCLHHFFLFLHYDYFRFSPVFLFIYKI